MWKLGGRGIQKICESCRRHGTPEPVFEILGGDITVKFTALEFIKASKHQGDVLGDVLEKKILELLAENNTLKQKEIAEQTKTSVASVQRAMKKLVETGKISRKAGKRYGYWEV